MLHRLKGKNMVWKEKYHASLIKYYVHCCKKTNSRFEKNVPRVNARMLWVRLPPRGHTGVSRIGVVGRDCADVR